LATVQIA